jgi:hypothetical protein
MGLGRYFRAACSVALRRVGARSCIGTISQLARELDPLAFDVRDRNVAPPNPAVNPDAPSAWPRSSRVLNRRRVVERRAGAPVTLVR